MKTAISFLLLGLSLNAGADTITLKDGTHFEGTVEGEMDGVKLIKTQYGSLNINSKDIEKIAAPAPAAEPPAASTDTAAVPVPAVPAELPPAPRAEPEFTFKTVTLSTMSFEKIYFENGVAIATETFDSKGALLTPAGAIKDGSYKEYYDNGNLKTEKTVINALTSGTLNAYYPSGVLQSSAYYLQGTLSGTVRIYSETAKLIFEQNFKDGLPNGWFREFDAAGVMKSELFYTDGHVAEKPKAAETKAAEIKAAEPPAESLVTAKAQSLARGEQFSFYLNNKYIAKLRLDKDLNIISKDGKVPDGGVKVYDKDGKIEKEFFFLKNELGSLKIYAGKLAGEYTFKEGKAVKK